MTFKRYIGVIRLFLTYSKGAALSSFIKIALKLADLLRRRTDIWLVRFK